MAVLESADPAQPRATPRNTGTHRWLLALGAFLALYVSWQLLRWIPARQQLIGDLAFVPLSVAAIYASARAAARCSGSPRLRQAWWLVALALTLYLAGNLVVLLYEVALFLKPYPSVADALYLCVYPVLLAGLLRFPGRRRIGEQTAELVLDLAIVAIGTSAVFVYGVLGPGAIRGSTDTLQTAFSIALPTGDMILLVGLVSVLLRGGTASSRTSLRLIAAALILRVGADIAYGYITLHGTYSGGDSVDMIAIAALALFAIAPLFQREVRVEETDDVEPVVRAQLRLSWLPYAAVAVVFTLFAVVERKDPLFPDQVLAYVAMLLAALVAVRQLLVQQRLLSTQVALRHARDELSALATTDALTGLANHRAIVDAVDLELSRARRHGHPFAVLFLDLDHFKELNDTFGHLVGDEALHELGVVLRSCLREVDSVGRWGGEEFVVVLPESDGDAAFVTAERIRKTVMEHTFDSSGTSMTCSIGVAAYPGDSLERSKLVELADTAMYRAKRNGRNCTVAASAHNRAGDNRAGDHAHAHDVIALMGDGADAETRAQYLADHDILTGLFNRGRLTEALDAQLRHAAECGSGGAVLLIDVDNFKLVNDSYGHSEGDRLLKLVAEMIRSSLRASDIAARLGSDEFAVILPETSESDAVSSANQIRRMLHDRVHGPGVQSSVGVCAFGTADELSPDDVMIGADIALYEAKEQGGDRTVVYRGHGGAVLTWVDRIWTALAENRFVLYGQPIVSLSSGEVVRKELLIRMISEDGDVIPPDAFLPTAERFGLVTAIDRWVTDEALRIAAAGEAISFNLSAASIGDERILASVREAIAAGLDPDRVLFEVTETAAMTNLDGAREFATDLTGMGCDLALDDFGTGFGSFTYLKHLPVRYLKIDMEFVRDLPRNSTDQEVVQAICAIAHSLGKRTIAEGVESGDARAMLVGYGVDFAQGYYIGRPKRISPPTDLERRLLRARALRPPRRARPGAAPNHDAAAGRRSR